MIITYRGRYFDYNNISKDSIDIVDIAHALPRINRFVGHCSRAYSVGEHTYIGLVIAIRMGYTPLQQLHWLIHDFTEAYVGDCPSPLKILLPEYIKIEKQVANAIMDYVGLEPMTEEEQDLVHRIDKTMLLLEMRDLTLHDHFDNLTDLAYLEILNSEDYNLTDRDFSLDYLTHAIEWNFQKLLKKVKGDV